MPFEFQPLWVLAGVRFATLFVMSPFFGSRLLPPWALLPFAATMGLLGASSVMEAEHGAGAVSALEFGPLAFEVALGALLGLTSRLLFSVFELFGELACGVVAPITGRISATSGETSSPGTFWALLGTVFYLMVGGHHALLGAFTSTFKCLPPGGVGFASDFVVSFGTQFTGVFAVVIGWSVLFALPLFFAVFAVQLTVGIVGRFGQFGLEPTNAVFGALGGQVAFAALWYTVVRLSIDLILAFVADHPLCAVLLAK